jgi:hypothetical protein
MAFAQYRIRALLICHYVRLNTSIETVVELDHLPTEQEALKYLWPIADERVKQAWCEDCPYELYVSVIEPVGSLPESG